ncbi:Ras-related C3 botulinum toxin substrate 1 [Pancytospora epiphaga]|nr:Ras-related C3 botulinum toxin substrate 1 [Pancytospora epiphaga]
MNGRMLQAQTKKIKVVFVGGSRCGKTNMIINYLNGVPSTEHKPTLFENYSKDITYNGDTYTIFICDTGGHHDFYRLKKMSYMNTNVFVLCVSYGEREGFKEAEKWMADLKKTTVPILLCMTKADLPKGIPSKEIEEFCKKHKIRGLFECSAADRSTLKQLFKGIVKVHVDKEPVSGGLCCSFCKLCY